MCWGWSVPRSVEACHVVDSFSDLAMVALQGPFGAEVPRREEQRGATR